MTKRALWHLTLMMGTFLLLNTFVFDNSKATLQKSNSTENIDIDHLPLADLKNTIGDTICSSISLGDMFITMSSDNLPRTLLNGSSTVYLIKKSEDKIFLYSDKISPIIKTHPPLDKGAKFLVLTALDGGTPKLAPAIFNGDRVDFLFDTPTTDGIALVETKNGLSFLGMWDNAKTSLVSAYNIDSLSNLITARDVLTAGSNERFYCLENDLVQVVFSNKGGAVSEYNLKLKSKENPSSPVLSVAVDRKMQNESPKNNQYPLHKTYVINSDGNSEQMKQAAGGYTPLLRRDILDKSGEIHFKVPPKNYALALTAPDKAFTPTFKVTKFTKDSIQFKGKLGGKEVTRTYNLVKDAPYSLEMKNSMNGRIANLSISSGIPEVEIDSGGSYPSLLYYNYNGKKMKLKGFKMPKTSTTTEDISPSWTANTNGFFAIILHTEGETAKGITTKKIEGKDCPSRVTLVDIDKALNPKEKFPGYVILTPYKASLTPSSYFFYGGPLDKNVLTKVDEALTDGVTGFNPEFVKALTVRGWLTLISDPFSKFMNIILDFFHMITGSWGISVILLTITLRLILYPFTAKSFKSMIKMKKLAPKQKAIETKYKGDPQRARTELAMLFRNEGVNPLASILPMLLQFPFFIGMFDLLKTKFALRGAAFIPGWIDNLTAPDVVFSWGINIPFLGDQFHLLPILGALCMHLSQKVTSSMQPTKKNPTDMEKQMKTMGPIMTVVIGFMFYNLASGLNLYLIISTLLGVLQQWQVNRKYGDKNPDVTIVKS